MPRARLKDLDGYLTTSQVAAALDLSPYLVKARIEDGTLPPASKHAESGVLLFDDAWIEAAQGVLVDVTPRKRRLSTVADRVPSPEKVLGHRIGEPGWLPSWNDVVRYFEALSAASDRVDLEIPGESTGDRPYLVVAVSAPENLRPEARKRTREALADLWDPRATTPQEVERHLATARTVGVILATQHSNEIGAMLMTMQLAHDLAVATDEPTLDLLTNTIALLVPSHNPDGIDLIASWCERWRGTPHEGVEMPWLYHPYTGHDNNRDWFMLTQRETRLYVSMHNREHPQAVFDMHQMGRFGPRFMVPPFIDPLDPNHDPLIQQGFAALGSHIAQRLTAAGKAGVVTNAIFDNYSPSLAYGNYHGSVDLLSEAASAKLATTVTLAEEELNDDYGIDPTRRAWNQPQPWKGGEWALDDIVSCDLIAARAFLDHLARNRRQWLDDYATLARRITTRAEAPYAFVFPPDQRDPRATAELLSILQQGLVEVHEATASFVADGIAWPAGACVVRLDQPAGAFAKTLLEVQVYPDVRKWKDGPALDPYDISGHTLPLQMGVRAIQVDTPLSGDAPLRLLDELVSFEGAVTSLKPGDTAWVVDARSNALAAAVPALHARGVPVYRARQAIPGVVRLGDALIPREAITKGDMAEIARAAGATVHGGVVPPDAVAWRQRPVRLGVYQPWTASIDEGWARWVLEEYGVPYETVRLADLRQGDLRDRFDVLLIPEMSAQDFLDGRPEKTREKDPYPPEYVGGLGDAGREALRQFADAGGSIVAIDSVGEALIDVLALPVELPLRDRDSTVFSCPGSILRVVMDASHPLALGLPRQTAVLFKQGIAFDGSGPGVTTVGRYPNANPLLSGWIHGPRQIEGKGALVDVTYGAGTVVLIGFRPYFRGQARGTYGVLFNAINRPGLTETTFGAEA